MLTDRLVLQPIGPEHASDLWQVHQDPWVARWADAFSPERAEKYAGSSAAAWRRDGIGKWIAYDRDTGDVVGRGGLSRMRADVSPAADIGVLLDDPGWSVDPLEVGWSVMGAHRGRGIAVEIGRAALEVAFGQRGAGRVVAFTERHNLASRRVMEKLGMSVVGEIRWQGLIEGRDDQSAAAPFVVYSVVPAGPSGDGRRRDDDHGG